MSKSKTKTTQAQLLIDEIVALEVKEEQLEEALNAARREVHEAQDRLAVMLGWEKHGLRIGDDIDVAETNWRNETLKYRLKVTGFSIWLNNSNPEIIGLIYKKDGTLAKRKKSLFVSDHSNMVKIKKVRVKRRKETTHE